MNGINTTLKHRPQEFKIAKIRGKIHECGHICSHSNIIPLVHHLDKYDLKSCYLRVFTANLFIFVLNEEMGAKCINVIKTNLKNRILRVQNS